MNNLLQHKRSGGSHQQGTTNGGGGIVAGGRRNKTQYNNMMMNHRSFLRNPRNWLKLGLVSLICLMMYFNITYNFKAMEGANVEKNLNLPNDENEKMDKNSLRNEEYDELPMDYNLRMNNDALNPEKYRASDGCDFSKAVELFRPSELEINCNNIHTLVRGKKLGSGYWRKVYEADFNGKKVAMKLVRSSLLSRSDIVRRHTQEAAVLFQLRHAPNVVKMVGWCNTTIIVEYVPDFLEELVFNTDNELPVLRALELALDATRGVEQLHAVGGGPFAHTDIQTRQLLINDKGTLLLNDFNRMKYTGPRNQVGKEKTKCLFRTPVAKGKWRAPEEYSDLNLDEKLDIYSLSMVLWTLRAREPPFEGVERDTVYRDVVEIGIRPDLTKMADFPQAMQDLIVEGWDQDPLKRPTAKDMGDRIETILASYIP